jgi:CRISPR/Cas system-associated endoribonuclease Cas2
VLVEAIIALGAFLSTGVVMYVLGYIKALRREYEASHVQYSSYRTELKDTIQKLSDSHNQLMRANEDMVTKLSTFEMKLRSK